MKSALQDPVKEAATAEDVYVSRYNWLLRWAIHFCGGDREAAEDLVQDTFVQMLSSWSSIRDAAHPERFLYSYLRYGFLRRRSLGLRYSFQTLSSLDFESLELSAAQHRTSIIEWQDELRSAVDFLGWRKNSTKSASMLLLRFFHGFYPSEIMRIARLSRKAVDDSLANAREETKAYLANPKKLQVMHCDLPPAIHNSRTAVPTDEFLAQMLQRISDNRTGDCLSASTLTALYSDTREGSIDCLLLAHLVSCPQCLDVIARQMSLPPRGSRPLEDILGYAPRMDSHTPSNPANSQRRAMQSLAQAKDKYRMSFEHKPRRLMVIVNGDLIASRDLSSSLNELTVELKPDNMPELIEITSEQALLLTAPIVCLPPDAGPEQHFEAALSDDRHISLRLEFLASGIRVHVTYEDAPSYSQQPTLDFPMMASSSPTSADHPRTSLWEGLHRWFDRPRNLRRNLAWACIAIAAAGAGISIYLKASQPHVPELLASAIKAETETSAHGVECQRVRISTPDGTLIKMIHRDISHKHQPKSEQLTGNEIKISSELASANIGWNDPLSAVSYRDWHDQQHNPSDSVAERDGKLILTTVVREGTVRETSLTLRADTLRTIARTAEFQDNEQIEIAELDDQILPWDKSDPNWFEAIWPNTPSLAPTLTTIRNSKKALPLSPSELDDAELSARVALMDLHADNEERLTIQRRESGVVVSGLVATDNRKLELENHLHAAPHVTTDIRTFAAFDAEPHVSGQSAGIAMSSSEAQASPLDKLLTEQHRSIDEGLSLHHELLDAAFQLRQSGLSLNDLDKRFGENQLSEEGTARYLLLRQSYAAHIRAALKRERQVLLQLQGSAAPQGKESAASLSEAVLYNSQLCFELLSRETSAPRQAEQIIDDLSSSLAEIEGSIEATKVTAVNQTPSSHPAIKHDNQ